MKRLAIIILLVVGFVFLNDRAALYHKELTPCLINFLPFDLRVDYYSTKYHLRDRDRKYPIVCSESNFICEGDHSEIYIKELKAIYWTNDIIVADVLSKKGRKLLKIKAGIRLIKGQPSETHVQECSFVSKEILVEMDDEIVFEDIPTILKLWPILGLLYLIILFLVVVRLFRR
jgi:hypothetical protein